MEIQEKLPDNRYTAWKEFNRLLGWQEHESYYMTKMFQKALVDYVDFKVGNMTIILGLDTDERKQQRTLHLTFELEQEHVKKSVIYSFDVDE